KQDKAFKGKEIVTILESLTGIERIGNRLTRKGINFEKYLKSKHPDTGRFPKYHVTIKSNGTPEHYFAYTDAELKSLRQDVERRIGRQLEIFDDESDGDAEIKSAFKWVEIFSSSTLSKLISALEKKGFTVDQYGLSENPLCSVVDGENKISVYSLQQLLNVIRDMGRKNLNIQRYKGLGEMNPDQLYDTTMDPDNRKLLKVVLEDAVRADEIFTTLMGTEVEPRRQFIEQNALNVKNLDV
ncbi:DNA gyrase subunit B, partial [Verrucomicrobiota bacterium]